MAQPIKVEMRMLKSYRRAAFVVLFFKHLFRMKGNRLSNFAEWLLKRGMRYRCGGKWMRIDWSKD